MKKIALPITISSRYFDASKVTRSVRPDTLRRICNSLRRGDGDEIRMHDAEGERVEVIDLGRGPELLTIEGI